MTDDSEKATVWLKPDQVDRMRDACYEVGQPYLQQRNECLITFLADTGMRVNETVLARVEHLRENNTRIYLPAQNQKQYPTESGGPTSRPVEFQLDTGRLLKSYLNNCWKDSPFLFPSRQSPRMTTESVRNVVRQVAREADIRPYREDGSHGTPEDVHPHAFRHSVAYRMLQTSTDYDMYDVRNRLRHRSITTTERIYDHFDVV